MENSKEKQIEDMVKDVCKLNIACEDCNAHGVCKAQKYAERFYNAGYRKIYDDHQRQCTCYALGCQMAEGLKRD
ncbi:MAG: hypothetical protein U0M06_07540, partial [Clostridia bacterium]|nr:hypothetical protein [Clostridia bacterium]